MPDMYEHPKVDHVNLYSNEKGEWVFTAYSTNGDPLVRSTEGYENHGDALGCIHGVFGDDVKVGDELESDGS